MSSFINIGLLTKEPGGRMNLCRAKGMPVDANFICFLYKLDIPDKFGVEILWAPVGGGVSTWTMHQIDTKSKKYLFLKKNVGNLQIFLKNGAMQFGNQSIWRYFFLLNKECVHLVKKTRKNFVLVLI